MTAAFTTTNLVGNRVLVKGTDLFGVEGQTVLDSSQWVELNQHKLYDAATDVFNKAVDEFFAPLLAAQENFEKVKASKDEMDPATYIVLSEAVEGVEPKAAHLVKLTHDSVVLRLIEEGQADRLAWVGDGLEVLADSQASAVAGPADEAEMIPVVGE